MDTSTGNFNDRRYAFDFFRALNDRLKPYVNQKDPNAIIKSVEFDSLVGIINAQPIFCIDRRDFFPQGFAVYSVNDPDSVRVDKPLVIVTDYMLSPVSRHSLHLLAQTPKNLALADVLNLRTRETYFTKNGDIKYKNGMKMMNPLM